MSASKLRVALCQMLVGANKQVNLANAVERIQRAKQMGAELVVLPECFNSPYGTKFFDSYAEPITPGNPSYDHMSAAAKDSNVWLVAGSIPERSGTKLFNSCMIFNPQGELVGVHRKMHLFRINTDAVKFDEAEVLTGGDRPCVIPVRDDLKLGVGICFDARFPQLALKCTEAGTSILIYPGAFNMVTGPAHWELLARARAVDNQQFVLFCSPARDASAGYVAWGHSLVVDPWGNVLKEAAEGDETIIADLDLDQVADTRRKVPSLAGTRHDVYQMQWSSEKQQ